MVKITRKLFEENQEILAYLKGSRLFDNVPDSELKKLLPVSEIKDFDKDDEILTEGQINTYVYFLIRGEVSVYAEGEFIISLRRSGDIFGEMSIISHKPCSATVIADTPVHLFCVQSKDIGEYNEFDSSSYKNILYRLFAMILTDKLSLTTHKAKQFEKANIQLAKVKQELQETNETLEQRIEERTIALKEANQQLQRELLERKRLEEEHLKLEHQLNQSQKMQVLGTLASGIAHNFNNLLTPILGFSELAQNQMEPESKAYHFIDRSKNAALQAKDLVSQIQVYCRNSALKRNMLDLSKNTKEGIELLKRMIPKNILISTHISGKILPIMGDDAQLKQVLMNLCVNATHAMPEGGELTITVRDLERYDLLTSQQHQISGEFFVLEVKDTGHGMTEETIKKIFDPFFTTKGPQKGVGLGLSTLLGIVEQHQGGVDVQSQVNQGSTFTIYLPTLYPVNEELLLPKQKEQKVLLSEFSVLLIDDEGGILEFLKEALTLDTTCTHVTESLSAKMALEQLKQDPHAYNVIVTDYMMPEMNGLQFTEKIRAMGIEIPVIMSTGYDSLEEEELKQSGINEVIIKPYELKDLLQLIEKVLQSSKT
ncbi:ATP-binding protein [Deltaproteobacteria bacterium TL4]